MSGISPAHTASVFHRQRDGAPAAPRHEIASKAEILVRTGLTTVGQAGGDVGLEEAARFHRSVVDLPQC
jgi:hypothetical protein